MSKFAKLALIVAIAAVAIAVVATKSFVPVTSAAMHPAVIASAHAATRVSPPEMMAIVSAPVIDTKAEVFVGTGDGSGGAWGKP